MVARNLYLPNECWEIVFKFLNGDGNIYNSRYMNSLSIVSKQFLHITNCFRFSLIIWNSAHPFLGRLFQRFPNLTTLDLSYFRGDINELLGEISLFQLKITSLNLSNQTTIPADGLRAFSQNITTNLTSLICYNIKSISITHLLLIADCFPFLEELDFSNPILVDDRYGISEEGISQILRRCYNIRYLNLACCSREKLHGMNFDVPKLEALNLSHTNIDDETLYVILKSCSGLFQLYLENCRCITDTGVMDALENCTRLREINLRGCYRVVSHFDDIVASLVFSRPSLRKIIVPPYYRSRGKDKELFLSDAFFPSILKLLCSSLNSQMLDIMFSKLLRKINLCIGSSVHDKCLKLLFNASNWVYM